MGLFGALFGRKYATISAAAAREIVDNGGLLVDVRSLGEWKAGHAPAAKHLPVDVLARRASELPTGTPIVTICKAGPRSAAAARTLAALGYEVSSARGGMHAWHRAGGRVVGANGREGTVL